MTTDKNAAQEDLAFLRRLVSADADGSAQRGFGYIYALWGAAFAVPMLLQWLGMIGVLPLPDGFWLAATVAIVLVLTVGTIVFTRRARPLVGVQARAWRAVFAGVGWANLAVLVALVLTARTFRDDRIVMIQPVVVFAFQGAAWFALWALRKVAWTGLVAAGWFVFAGGMGATIGGANFMLVGGLGLVLLMVVPGLVLARAARPAA